MCRAAVRPRQLAGGRRQAYPSNRPFTGAGGPPGRNLYERVRARFAPLGGVDLELPEREPTRELPRFN